MKKAALLIIALFFLVLPGSISAHSGDVDVYGCHHDGAEYHCHDGTNSHQICSQKYWNNPNLSKSLAQRLYEDCVRSMSPYGTYTDAQIQRALQESQLQSQAVDQQIQYRNDLIRQYELQDQQRGQENEAWLNSYIDGLKKENVSTCPINSSRGSNGVCSCNSGYQVGEVGESACVPSKAQAPTCTAGFVLNNSGKCIPTQAKCVGEYGKGAKVNSKGECKYCPAGYLLNDSWMCEKQGTQKAESLISTSTKSNTEEVVGVSPKSPVVQRIKGWFKRLFR